MSSRSLIQACGAPAVASGQDDTQSALLTRRSLLLSVAAATLILPAGTASAAAVAGAVSDLTGDAFAEAAGQRRPLATGANVFVADTVATGEEARVALKLGRATLVRLRRIRR